MQLESFLTLWQRLGGSISPGDFSLLSDAKESFRGCYLELEHVVAPVLVAEAKRLGAWPVVE
jgi:hypothetical protein